MTISRARTISFHMLLLIPLLAFACSDPSATCAGPVDVRGPDDAAALQSCRAIDGDLRITGRAVGDLRGLEGITSARNVVVADTSLTDLAGLRGLREVAGISVVRNARLASLRGLDGVHRAREIVILENSVLVRLDGLENLETADEVSIAGNPSLARLGALSAIVHDLDATVENVPAASVDELDALRRRTARRVAALEP